MRWREENSMLGSLSQDWIQGWEKACWIAAAAYAKAIKSGESEAAAQQAAEREAYKVQYGVVYPN